MRTNDIKRLKSIVAGLKVQRIRIQGNPETTPIGDVLITSTHDADFYTILLRRAYRKIKKLAEQFPEISKIHSENSEFFEKIRIRDHFDKSEAGNWEDIEKIGKSNVDHLEMFKNSLVPIIANITILPSVIENKIISGPYEWDLEVDHMKLLEKIEETIKVLKEASNPYSEIDWKYI